MKNKRIITLALCACCAGTSVCAVGNVIMTAFADKAASTGYEMQIYNIDKDISLADDYLTDNEVDDLRNRIDSYEKQIKALRRNAGASEDMSPEECLDKADEMQYTVFSLRVDLAQYELQQAENMLYSEYSEAMTEEKQREEAYNAYDMLRKYEYNGVYLRFLNEYSKMLGQKTEVEQVKADEGYSMQVDADTLKAEKASADADIAGIKADMSYTEMYFEQNYGENIPSFGDEVLTLSDRAKTEKKFAESYCYVEYKKKQAQNLVDANARLDMITSDIAAFTAPKDNDHKMSDDVKNRLDKLKDNIQSKTELQSKQAEKYTLQAEEYECSLKLYIERLYSQADVLDKRIAAYDKQIAAANENIRIRTELYDSGMILEYELTEAKTTLRKLEAERTQLVCDRDRALYCLNNTVYRG